MKGRDCIFCRITSGELVAHAVLENERILAFLDVHPIRPGHTQIVPRVHYPYFDDLPPDLLAEIVETGQMIARAQKAIYGVERVGFAFTGSDIRHAHAHVIPMVEFDDLTSRRYIGEATVTYRPPPRPPDDELEMTAHEIRRRLSGR